MNSIRLVPVLLIGLLWGGCADSVPPSDSTASDIKIFDGAHGLVKEIVADGNMAIVTHEEIPGFMMGMTMTFGLREDSVRNAISAGDSIEFQVSFDGIDSWISRVRVIE